MNASPLSTENPNALPAGTRLGEFELRSLLGIGGFGIVYLAFDHVLEREVAVKEYMPAALAGRTETLQVSVRSQSDADTFALGLRSFVNEAKLLARFDHPSLLKVLRFWEANGTAYMAMPVLRGSTLKEVRQAMAQAPGEAWLRALLVPLLGAIEKLHAEGVFHRDIAPDNIQIEPDGRPVLLDFGAARRVIGDKSQNLTAILKPAYAPIEQYGEAGAVRQGPWTDIYALGATLHFVLLGRPPAPATARAVHDEASHLTARALPGISEDFLQIVDWMLAPRPADRPQSMGELRAVLDGAAPVPQRRPALPAAPAWERTVRAAPEPMQEPPPADDGATVVMAPPHPRPVAATPPSARPASGERRPAPGLPAPAQPGALALAPSSPPPGRRYALAAVAGGIAVLAVAAIWVWQRQAPAPALDAGVAASAPPVSAMAAASPAVPSAVQPAPEPVAESRVATVVVPAAPERREPLALSPPPDSTAKPRATARLVAPQHATSASAYPAAHPTADGATRVPAAVEAPAAADPSRPVAESPAPAAAVPPATALVEGPEALCAPLNPLRRFVCMERECLRPLFAAHADCKKWHKNAAVSRE